MSVNPLEHLYHEDLYLIPSRTLVILVKEWSDHSESEQLLLTRILGSVKLTLAGVQLVTLREFTAETVAAFSPAQIISFGAVSGSIKKYAHAELDGIGVVIADGLGDLDDARKKALWMALKQLFAI